MGADATAVGDHNLDTSSLEVLATQLAERFNALVVYGVSMFHSYESDFDVDNMFIIKGYAGDNEDNILRLWQHGYLEHVLGRRTATSYELALVENEKWILIFGDHFIGSAYFQMRWWNFCYAINGEIDLLKEVNEYRAECFDESRRMGGTAMLYHNDQQYNNVETDTWPGFVEQLETSGGLVNLSLLLQADSGDRKPDTSFLAFYDDFSYPVDFFVPRKGM